MNSRPVQDMCVDHRRRHVLVPEQFLNGANVVATFEQVGRKGMPKGVTAGRFSYPRSANREFDRILQVLFGDVMPTDLT